MRGDAKDLEAFAQEIEEKIRASGGVDLQILGLGRNGHIGFNEPGSSLGSRTRVKTLQEETLRDNSDPFSSPDQVPRFSLTMGIATILEAKRILLLATGDSKAAALRDAIEGPLTAELPAAALQLHPRVHLIVDEKAAKHLSRKDYWKWVYENKGRVGQ